MNVLTYKNSYFFCFFVGKIEVFHKILAKNNYPTLVACFYYHKYKNINIFNSLYYYILKIIIISKRKFNKFKKKYHLVLGEH